MRFRGHPLAAFFIWNLWSSQNVGPNLDPGPGSGPVASQILGQDQAQMHLVQAQMHLGPVQAQMHPFLVQAQTHLGLAQAQTHLRQDSGWSGPREVSKAATLQLVLILN